MKNKPKWIPRRPYEEAAVELSSLLEGMESDFIRRIANLFINKSNKFMVNVLYGGGTEITGEPKPGWASLEISEMMDSLLIAAREGDYNRLTIIEHNINSPSECLVGAELGNVYTA